MAVYVVVRAHQLKTEPQSNLWAATQPAPRERCSGGTVCSGCRRISYTVVLVLVFLDLIRKIRTNGSLFLTRLSQKGGRALATDTSLMMSLKHARKGRKTRVLLQGAVEKLVGGIWRVIGH